MNFIPFLILEFVLGFFSGPDELFQQINHKLSLLFQVPSEKVFVRTDQDHYFLNDEIRFALILSSTASNRQAQSRVAYIELFDGNGNLLNRQKLNVESGSASGALNLAGISGGNLLIRAYTRLMENQGPNSFYHQVIPLITEAYIEDFNADQFQFMIKAEPGSFVNGLTTKVGYLFFPPSNRYQGRVKDQNGQIITDFQLDNDGTGYFLIKPTINRQYQFDVVDQIKDSLVFTQPLPEVERDGALINLSRLNFKNRALVEVSDKFEQKFPGKLLLLVYSEENIYLKAVLDPAGNNQFVVPLPEDQLPEGLYKISLLHDSGKILDEKMGFRPASVLNLKIVPDQLKFKPRENASATIEIEDEFGKPLNGFASVRVFDSDFTNQFSQSNLQDWNNWLGKLELPAIPFQIQEVSDLEELLLSSEWNQFKLADLLQEPPGLRNVERMLHLEGQFDVPADGDERRVTVLLPESEMIYESILEKNGFFRIPLLFEVKGEEPVLFHLLNLSRENSEPAALNLMPDLYPLSVKIPELRIDHNDKLIQQLEFFRKKDDVYQNWVINKSEDQKDPIIRRDSDFFDALNLDPDFRIDLDQYVVFPAMEDVVKELLRGLIIRKRAGKEELRIYADHLNDYYPESPVLFINGIPHLKTDQFFELDPSNLLQIEIYSKPASLNKLGSLGKNGALNIITRQYADLENVDDFTVFKGFENKIPEVDPDLPEKYPDLRHHLLWQPVVRVENGKLEINWQTSDLTGRYLIQIDFYSDNGKWVSGKEDFLVVP